MDNEKVGKAKIAAFIALGGIVGFACGYAFGYSAAIDKLVSVGLQYLDIDLKPGAEAVIKAWLSGGT